LRPPVLFLPLLLEALPRDDVLLFFPEALPRAEPDLLPPEDDFLPPRVEVDLDDLADDFDDDDLADVLFLSPAFAARLAVLFFRGRLVAFFTRFGKCDGNRLVTILHFTPAAAFQVPLLHLVHRLLDVILRFVRIFFCHGILFFASRG
jgi:hypothetical protein